MRPLGSHWQIRTQGLNKERSITRPVPGYRPEIYFRIFKDLSLAFFLSEFELINDQDAYEKYLVWFFVVKDNQTARNRLKGSG